MTDAAGHTKVSTRRKARELAVQVLYQADLSGMDCRRAIEVYLANFDANAKAVPYARELIVGVGGRLDAIDGDIERHSANWRLARMSVVDRAILRIAFYEIGVGGIAARVAINEALEIGRRFSTDESVPFLNGILDAYARLIEEQTAATGGGDHR